MTENLTSVKISVGYSHKKSENFNSSQHEMGVETSILVSPSNAEAIMRETSANLFDLAKKLVHEQEARESAPPAQEPKAEPQQTKPEPPKPAEQPNGNDHPNGAANGNGNPNGNGHKPCSEKQIKCIWARGKAKGFASRQINALARNYKKDRLDELTAGEAYQVIQGLEG